MNLDLSSSFNYGDDSGLRTFLLDHRMVHEQTAAALSQKYGGSFSTFGLASSIAEEAWIEVMRNKRGPNPQSLQDWLRVHAFIHDITYQTLAGTGTVAPDLSVVDFGSQEQFYDWMYVHQTMHDFEQQTLGLS